MKVPVKDPTWQNKLSLDQMIGGFCLCLLFAASGYNLKLAAWGFAIASIVLAWRLLRRVAPMTADVILLIFMTLVLALISGGRRGYGRWRRW